MRYWRLPMKFLPAQLANVRAVEAGEKTWESQIDGAL